MVKLDVFLRDNKIREKQAKTIGFKFCLGGKKRRVSTEDPSTSREERIISSGKF